MRWIAVLCCICLVLGCAAKPPVRDSLLPTWKAGAWPDVTKPLEDAEPPDALALAIGDGYFLTFAFWLPGPHGDYLAADPAVRLHDGVAWREAQIVAYDPLSKLALIRCDDARAVPTSFAQTHAEANLAVGFVEERMQVPRPTRIGANGCGASADPDGIAWQIECEINFRFRNGVVLFDDRQRVVGFGHVTDGWLFALSPEAIRAFVSDHFRSWGRHALRKPAL